MIPGIIHQTWKTADIPERFRNSAESWQRAHPHWEYRLWTDADIDAFVAEHFPDQQPLFRSYPDQIQRVDAVRYMILYYFGGVYSDLDVECVRSVEDLCGHEVVLPKTEPVGLSNDFMMAEVGHPLFQNLIHDLAQADRRWSRWFVPRHFRVLLTTGPLYLSMVARRFERQESIFILRHEFYSSQDRSRAYVFHWPGNTWAGADTRLFNMLFHRWKMVAAGIAIALAAVIAWRQ